MTAPVKTDQPTQPLPIAGTENLPPGRNWLMSEHGVLLVAPGVPLAALVVGELVLRPFLLLGDEARSDFALTMLPLVLVLLVGGGYLFARRISRGKDGRS